MKRLRHHVFVSSGFSLIELLVVIAIIGILMALTLMAVQSARESARKMACSNKLKQYGLAMQTYHGVFRTFPPGNVMSQYDWDKGNANVLLLPYIEQQVPWDHDESVFGQPPEVYDTVIHLFVCPSDSQKRPVSITILDITFRSAPASYSQCKGIYDSFGFPSPSDWSVPRMPDSGVFDINSTVRAADILDGLSNTFAVGETASGAKVCAGIGCNEALPNWSAFHSWYDLYHVEYADPPETPRSGCYATTVEPLNKVPATASLLAGNSDTNFEDWWDIKASYEGGRHYASSFRSMHTGGAYFLMADGRVRWINDGINLPTYQALSTIAQGDLMSSDE